MHYAGNNYGNNRGYHNSIGQIKVVVHYKPIKLAGLKYKSILLSCL